jgi:hypothetical protein
VEPEVALKNPSDPVYFFGQVNHESVSNLIHQIRERTPHVGTLDVVLTSMGGFNSSAVAFNSWFSRFERKQNVRVIAAADVASAAIALFLAFDRRTADAAAVFRFHVLAPEKSSNDPAVGLLILETKKNLVDFVVRRTKLKSPMVNILMEERMPLSGETLFISGLCNEKP